jgi:penicillin-binding protein 1A
MASRRTEPPTRDETEPEQPRSDTPARTPEGEAAARRRASFAETSEIDFEFGDGAEYVPVPRRGEDEAASEVPDGDGAATARRDPRRGRVDRERPVAVRLNGAPGRTATGGGNGSPPGAAIPPPPPPPPSMGPKRTKPRLKKLRILFVLMGLGVLALVSTVFGMMAAVSTDLPAIYNFTQYKASKNSVMVDSNGQPLGTLTSDQNRILLSSGQISTNVKNAVVAIEDSRFYEHSGVDFQGIGRALIQDLLSRSAAQGASTITQQFVKNALETQGNRTVLEKFREAALAYRLEQHWSKDKILTEYLNTIYFGQGAYGIEAAARTYFGWNHPSCGTETEPCAAVLEPQEAALLAGVISSPSAYDPKAFPENALERRNLVLSKMRDQGYISDEQYTQGIHTALPAGDDIQSPKVDSEAPYFTSWVRQQLVDRYGAGRTYFGGLKVKTTLDLDLQRAAEEDVRSYLGGIPPTASVVVLDNHNAAVKAMVGGPNFDTKPFNLATQGHRQPGSSIKPFILTTALNQGISPYQVYTSAPQDFSFGKKGKENFHVTNYGDSYLGSCDIVCATQYSDNSIYSQIALGGQNGEPSIKGGTKAIARTIHRMGYTDPVSTNPAMVLGGFKEGVTPLQWAYAFSTLANNGDRVSGTLSDHTDKQGAPVGPVSFTEVKDEKGDYIKGGENDSVHQRVVPADVASTAKSILHNVVTAGTGTNANIGNPYQWGKTGTTENNGDAWFCGAIPKATACVWVGYADTNTPMTTLYNGGPVDGGTFPALIWASVMSDYLTIQAEHAADKAARRAAKAASGDSSSSDSSGSGGSSSTYVAPPTDSAPAPSTSAPAPAPAPSTSAPAPAPAPSPAPAPAPTPAPAPSPAPSGGGGTSAGGISGGTGPG